ncbi:MAG: uroporphyrinogen decarboxylase family protein [Cephaloticoccus sp.]|nr:uroporphyrinogen decarboxylase family protein [Cephaloticoccus sp.]MCF7761108.1 uroporphyrinogen decarboxylase family protein [Cephaloticoccus sp.]
MNLSSAFSIDPQSTAIKRHNLQARAIIDAFNAGRPKRVPFKCSEWVGQHGFYADEIGLDYRAYYTDPDLMLQVQLESARRKRELPVHDMILGAPPQESWFTGVDLWPAVAPGAFGCELLYRKETVIANSSRHLSVEECDALELPSIESGGMIGTIRRYHEHLVGNYENKLSFLGKKVDHIQNGMGTSGFFSLALDLRGEAIMSDMYENEPFVHRFLQKLADWSDALTRRWAAPRDRHAPFPLTDHGTDMLSPAMFEKFILPILLEKNRDKLHVPQLFHHCGRGQHLFPIINRHFKLHTLHALTFPLLDLERIREEVGDEVHMIAAISDGIVNLGKPDDVRQAVKMMLTPKLKGRGRLTLISGDLLPGTNMENLHVLYESVKEFGEY